MSPTPDDADDLRYEDDLARARDEGTDLIERTDDFPAPDHYHAARDLADLLGAKGGRPRARRR
jgi:hypothetical protein